MGERPDVFIQVNLSKFSLWLHEGKDFTGYPIGIGNPDTPTPTGNYWIWEMCENPQKTFQDGAIPKKLYGSRCIDLSVQAFDYNLWCWRHYSIHGTDDDSKAGTRCSHGCIIMRNSDIEELYEKVDVRTLVMIV